MFLRNFDNFLMGLVGLPSAPNTNFNYVDGNMYINYSGQFGDGSVNVKKANGSIEAMKVNNGSYVSSTLGMGKSNICLGTGNTPVTYEDYDLSGDIVSSKLLTYQSHEFTYDESTHKFKKRVTYTYSNTGSTDLVVSEWGLWTSSGTYFSSAVNFRDNKTYDVLLYREVLDEPLTIPAGVTSTLTFEVEFPMMHHI